MVSIDVPEGSIYYWMYIQGLKQIDLNQIMQELWIHGKQVRQKDVDNYWNGYNNSNIYHSDVFDLSVSHSACISKPKAYDTKYEDYPDHPTQGISDPLNRFVPCNKDNKPMIKWGQGCMTKPDAEALMHQVYLAENTKGCHKIIIDCDGNHGDSLDRETIYFLGSYIDLTECYYKQEWCNIYGSIIPVSFHLTFSVDKIIPTLHFPKAHIDIIGNKANSLRYFKDKPCNDRDPYPMDEHIWNDLMDYIKRRERKKE